MPLSMIVEKSKKLKTDWENFMSKQDAISYMLAGNENEKCDQDEKEIIEFGRLAVEN